MSEHFNSDLRLNCGHLSKISDWDELDNVRELQRKKASLPILGKLLGIEDQVPDIVGANRGLQSGQPKAFEQIETKAQPSLRI
jgi:hypothetical protein